MARGEGGTAGKLANWQLASANLGTDRAKVLSVKLAVIKISCRVVSLGQIIDPPKNSFNFCFQLPFSFFLPSLISFSFVAVLVVIFWLMANMEPKLLSNGQKIQVFLVSSIRDALKVYRLCCLLRWSNSLIEFLFYPIFPLYVYRFFPFFMGNFISIKLAFISFNCCCLLLFIFSTCHARFIGPSICWYRPFQLTLKDYFIMSINFRN